jgi:epoxyqueuosine reductase
VNSSEFIRHLKERAADLGLPRIGIAPIGPSDHAGFLRRWLDSGHAASMSWMQRTARDSVDLRRRFSWARSAVVAAVPYLSYRGDRHAQPGLVPHVARYALGRDYHAVLTERLERLNAVIQEEEPGTRTRVYVDTGPVLERELAARAGLGWFGKNTNLIGPRGDSWTLLGQILTSLDLPPDSPAVDRCGTCTACLDACPTGAIPEPYLVDSNRCISYLTIELRGDVPREQRADIDDWVLGCDICQEVCPWNRKVAPEADVPFQRGGHLEQAELVDIIGATAEEFGQRFHGTPFERPRRRGVVRNALIVAANISDEPALSAAVARLDDPDPVVRGTAAWAEGRSGGAVARRALQRARATETDPAIRQEIEVALDDVTT